MLNVSVTEFWATDIIGHSIAIIKTNFFTGSFLF